MDATQPAVAPARLPRLTTPLLIAGGLLWIATFILIVVNGIMTGTLPNVLDAVAPLYLRLGIRAFSLAPVALDLALLGLALALRRRAPILAAIAGFFAAVAFAMACANLTMLSGLLGTPTFSDTFGGLSSMITSLATLLLSIAGLRTGALPRPVAYLLLFVGVTTIPILFGTPLPVGPDYATDFLAFLTSGAAYVLAGARIRRAHGANPVGTGAAALPTA